ncbi:50S ribosomal protein L10 [uncultured archaeon]|nr:50S ribosomal protein L10 [uncultured archaeon]
MKDLEKLIESSSTVGIVDISSLPSSMLQNIKKGLRGSAEIFVTKKSVIYKAIETAGKKKEKISELTNVKAHIPALIVSNESPFKLYKKIQKNKSETAAKAGDIAPKDIVVQEGPTNLPPGPAIAEFQKAGIKAAIQGPNIVIKETKTVVKQGDVVNEAIVGILGKLNIKPMEISLNVAGIYEGGVVYGKDILAVDETVYVNQVVQAYRNAFNLAYNANYLTKDVVLLKLSEAYRNALNLGINAAVLEKEIIPHLLAKANLQALSVAEKVPKEVTAK